MSQRLFPRLVLAFALLALPLAGGCKKAKKTGPSPIKVESRPTLSLAPESSAIKNFAPAVVIPREVAVVFAVPHYAAATRTIGLQHLRKKYGAYFAKAAKDDFFDAADLGAMRKAGIDVDGPLTLLEVSGYDDITVAVLKLENETAFVNAFKAKYPTAPIKLVGAAKVLVQPNQCRTVIRDGYALQLDAKKPGPKGKMPALEARLTALTKAQSLAMSPTFRHVQKKLAYGKSFFVFVNLPQLLKSQPAPGVQNPFAGFLKELGGLAIGANVKGGGLIGKFYFALPQTGPFAGVLKLGQAPIGWTLVDKAPSLGLRLQLDVKRLLTQVLAGAGKLVSAQLDTPTPIGKSMRQVLEMFEGKIELYAHVAPNIATKHDAFDFHLIARLADPKGVQGLLEKFAELASRDVGVKKTAGQTWYAIYIPPIKKTLRFAVLQSHFVLSTEEGVVLRLLEGKTKSFVDNLADADLKTMFRANDALFAHVDFASFAALAKLGKKANAEDEVYIPFVAQLGTLSVAVDDVRDGIGGPIAWKTTSPSLASWIDKMIPHFQAMDAIKRTKKDGKK